MKTIKALSLLLLSIALYCPATTFANSHDYSNEYEDSAPSTQKSNSADCDD